MEKFADKTVVDSAGEPVGPVNDVIYDENLQPEFVTIRTGRLVHRDHVVPVAVLDGGGDVVRASATRDQLLSAPTSKQHMVDRTLRSEVYEHFRLEPHPG